MLAVMPNTSLSIELQPAERTQFEKWESSHGTPQQVALQAWNQNPKPFIWTATVGQIIEKVDRARVKMEQIRPGSTLPRGKKRKA